MQMLVGLILLLDLTQTKDGTDFESTTRKRSRVDI
jgi:hypothetical protein